MTLKKNSLAGLVAAICWPACGALPDKPARAALYDFGPGLAAPAAAAGERHRSAPRALPMIALAEVDANSRLDGTQLLYRLGYADCERAAALRPVALEPAAGAAAAPAAARGSSAGHACSAPGGERHHRRAPTGRLPDSLRVTLEEFSQYFESPRARRRAGARERHPDPQPARRRPGAGPAQRHRPQAGPDPPTVPAASRPWPRPAMRWWPSWWPGSTRPAEAEPSAAACASA